jgi:hypothetical protein
VKNIEKKVIQRKAEEEERGKKIIKRGEGIAEEEEED